MTSIVNNFTVATLNAYSYDYLTTTVGLISIFLLIFLLVLLESMRVVGGARRDTWARTLYTAIAPLFIAFSVIVINRLLSLLH
jgi:hypothetical protein